MLRNVKELREQRAKLVADAHAILEAEAMTPEQETQFDKLMGEADKLKAEIDRHERLYDAEAHLAERQQRQAADRGVSTGQIDDEEKEKGAAFNAYLRVGVNGMNEQQRAIAVPQIQNAQSIGTPSGGGYTVPQGFFDALEDAQKAYGGMINVAYVFDTETGNALPIPTDNDTSNAGAILTENTQVGAQDLTFGSVTLNAYVYTSKLVLVSNQLLQDSAFDLETFLSIKLGTRIARAINTHFTVGTGTSQPNGVVTAATSGKVGLVGQTLSLIYDDLIDLEHAVDPAYRNGAKFMMHDQSLKVVKKLKDTTGRPLWLPGLAFKEPDTINGYGYSINQDMPVMAANAKSVIFGDFSRYYIRKIPAVQVLRLTERYADYNQTGFLAFQRWDGNLVDAGTHPIQYYANSAT